jgi:cold shock protein
MAKGTVKWFDNIKGYGFIAQESGEQDVFVHMNNIQTQGGLREGDKVEYNVVNGKKGLNADNVKIVD